MRTKLATLMLAGTIGVGTTGCETNAQTGALIGALGGAVAGHQVDGKKGRYIGAAVGALAGGLVGNYMDDQEAELQRKLAAEATRKELKVTRLPNGSLKVGLAGDASFDTNSATIRTDAQQTFAKIAEVLKDYDKTIIHVIGHTDSRGSDQHNQALSERRSAAVANFIAVRGVQDSRIRREGRGEYEPVASNDTVQGRAANRRVDIVIQPVVEGRENEAYQAPSQGYGSY